MTEHDRHWHQVRRSKMFTALPAALVSILAGNFLWEAVRANVKVPVGELPWRLSVLDLPTTANLLAVFGGLMLARAQFAKTVRPHFGYGWMQKEGDGGRWILYFFNAGPGHATVTQILYRIAFHGEERTGASEWIRFPDLDARLRRRGIEEADAELTWIGRTPVVPQQRGVDGLKIGEFSYRALAAIGHLDVEILAEDSVGDRHRLLIRSTARLPSKATRVIDSLRAREVADRQDAAGR
ncbi:hypothetical protein RM555_11390 [Micromonospora sp. DSM 115977]|uniref:Uncharacterized protein n=1 Tax=Micromonospora reichwaldensis TaxID=3075516 RepID=A0ABU2WUI3_9ACTN|nr:hypothetical protein [Micromonospora sp. DSM 115977]MDT0529590.1 hypothetical protein [Micromonospora sp. DSM 115977]